MKYIGISAIKKIKNVYFEYDFKCFAFYNICIEEPKLIKTQKL